MLSAKERRERWHNSNMEYGFRWGQVTVERVASMVRLKTDKEKWRVLTITTPREQLEVYVSPSGKIRVWKEGVELVNK